MTDLDLLGPLPQGTTVLEASAGTGKTYTIAALATRWVAETTLRLTDLLIVTFTRAATAELRDRVRSRLVGAVDHLTAVRDGSEGVTDDPLLEHLAATDLELRLRRLQHAVRDVDSATIATIHGFCQVVLDGLGLASELDRAAELVDGHDDLVEQVVDDLMVATFAEAGAGPVLDRSKVLALANLAIGNPDTDLRPLGTDDPEVAVRRFLAERVRVLVSRRARRARAWSFDDLLVALDAALQDPRRGSGARQELRRRYRVALVDEFQDTDPVQWRILETAFHDDPPEPERALVLIGDPKQAIYRFRGGDVHSYLAAVSRARQRLTLGTSYRADAPLLDALHALFDGGTFGDPEIAYRRVASAPGRDDSALVGAPDPAPVRLRLLPRRPDLPRYQGRIIADVARDAIGRDVAGDVAKVLGAGTALRTSAGTRPLRPGDIAVLVRTNDQAARIHGELRDVGVPAVINGVDSVLQTRAASDWQWLLDALERPTSTQRVRALAASAWFGWDARSIAGAPDSTWDELHAAVNGWARLLADRGVAALHRAVATTQGTHGRLLERADGRRYVADLDHIGELLHAAATADHLGPAALADWLRLHVAEASRSDAEERLRRLESDADAVQVLTIHRSKGLEFALVYCPYLWSTSGREPTGKDPVVFHDDDRRRALDVGGDHPEAGSNRRRAAADIRGEELRLLYVALTRAAHQVVLWFAPAGVPAWSGLNRFLLRRDDDGALTGVDDAATIPKDDAPIERTCRRLAARAGGGISVTVLHDAASHDAVRQHDRRRSGGLAAARFDRSLDQSWRRTSYSALTRIEAPYEARPQVASEPEDGTLDDEATTAVDPGAVGVDPALATAADDPLLPLAGLRGGTDVGTFVHAVLEDVDLAADDLHGALTAVADAHLRRWRLGLDRDVLVAGLEAAIATPLGPLVDDRPLRGVARVDRLDELEFELPLDADPTARRSPRVGDLLDLLVEHLPADDPLADYPAHVPPEVRHRELRGFLAGSIDLVLRHRRSDGTTRYVVIDHKTNVLAPRGAALEARHYHPDALALAMVHGHYPLQALLYQAALHRFLRWRVPGYDPAIHLGGALYTFLRGMIGPATPRADGAPYGVFAWAPRPALVVATSDLLHHRVAA